MGRRPDSVRVRGNGRRGLRARSTDSSLRICYEAVRTVREGDV